MGQIKSVHSLWLKSWHTENNLTNNILNWQLSVSDNHINCGILISSLVKYISRTVRYDTMVNVNKTISVGKGW